MLRIMKYENKIREKYYRAYISSKKVKKVRKDCPAVTT